MCLNCRENSKKYDRRKLKNMMMMVINYVLGVVNIPLLTIIIPIVTAVETNIKNTG